MYNGGGQRVATQIVPSARLPLTAIFNHTSGGFGNSKQKFKAMLRVNKTDTDSRVCGDYILIFRDWKRSIDRLTDKNTAIWIDR